MRNIITFLILSITLLGNAQSEYTIYNYKGNNIHVSSELNSCMQEFMRDVNFNEYDIDFSQLQSLDVIQIFKAYGYSFIYEGKFIIVSNFKYSIRQKVVFFHELTHVILNTRGHAKHCEIFKDGRYINYSEIESDWNYYKIRLYKYIKNEQDKNK